MRQLPTHLSLAWLLLGFVSGTSADPTKSRFPGSLAGRDKGDREKHLKDEGGTAQSEAAVEKGLRWLALHQAPEGHWALDQFHTHARADLQSNKYVVEQMTGVGKKNDVAGTGFGVLPFLAHGVTHKPTGKEKDDVYVKTVRNGLNWLLRNQGKDGGFQGVMYGHALGTLALCEAYGMTADPLLKRPAQSAINYIVAAQDPQKGGWRYNPKQGSDQSVTGWQIMALKSGQMAGLQVPAATLKAAEKWVLSVKDDNGGYGYIAPNPTPTMTASGLLSRLFMGTPKRHPDIVKGIELLEKTGWRAEDRYRLFWATQVMFHHGGEPWERWNEGNKTRKGVRDALIESQDRDGSWNPKGDPNSNVGGRVMTTSLALLTLEVYYRYLPVLPRGAPPQP
jgi:hypothetical protein